MIRSTRRFQYGDRYDGVFLFLFFDRNCGGSHDMMDSGNPWRFYNRGRVTSRVVYMMRVLFGHS